MALINRTRNAALCAVAIAALSAGSAFAQAANGRTPSGSGSANITLANEDQSFAKLKAQRTAVLAGLTPVTDETLNSPADGDWFGWRRTNASLGHSPLKQIDRTNVKGLSPAWAYTLPVSGNEITPLVHDGVLFVASAASVVAIDGATGDQLWRYNRASAAASNNGRAIIKSIGIYQDRLFVPTLDGSVVALDVKTGKVVWDHKVLGEAELKATIVLDGGPTIAKGKVIMGASGCNTYKGGCFIFALDAATGEEAWRFHTIARPGQPGGDTWNGAPVEERFGGSVWTSGSYDPTYNLVYFGVGNTYDSATLLTPRPGQKTVSKNDGLYTASTVALDPGTGKLVWWFQHVNREVWDLDWVFEQSLITMPVKGKTTDLLVTGGKIALFDAIDRKTGKYAFSTDAGIQTLVTAIDPKTGKKTINPALEPELGVTKHMCPHSGGGRSWTATATDPNTKIMYVPITETCQEFTWVPRDAKDTAAGGSDMRFVLKPRPDSDGRFGRLQAIDLATGKTVWTQRRRAAYASATLVTDGGLVFIGAKDRFFYAYDAATGEPLWRTRLSAAPAAVPITYSAGGHQYVAIVAGDGGPFAWLTLTPEVESPSGGTHLQVFRLPDSGPTPAQ